MPDAPMNGTAAPAAAPSASPSAAPAAKSPSAPAAAGATPTGPQTAAPQTPAAKAEAARFKFKHGEQEFDWSQDDVQRNFQIGLNADKRMNDAARREKALAQREAALTGKNPEDILRAAGLDPDGWAFERTEQALQRQQMPEHERKLMESEARAKALEEKLTAREQQEQQARAAQEMTVAERELESSYLGALEEFGFRPQSDPKHKDLELGIIVPLMAQEEHFLSEAGIRPTAKEIAARVRGRLDTLVQHQIADLAPEKLYAALEKWRPGAFNDLARHAIALRRAPQEPVTPATVPSAPPEPTTPAGEMSPREALAERRDAFGQSRWRSR